MTDHYDWDNYLKQLRYLHSVEASRDKLDVRIVTDIVRGSHPDFPYTTHCIRVQGFDCYSASSEAAKLDKFIEHLKVEVDVAEQELRKRLNDIEDENVRVIASYAFLYGQSHRDIAEIVHYDHSWVGRILQRLRTGSYK